MERPDGSRIRRTMQISKRRNAGELGGLARGPHPATFYPWLLVASGAALNVIQGKVHPAWAAASGLAAFAVLYVAAIWLRISACRHRAALTAMIVLGVLTGDYDRGVRRKYVRPVPAAVYYLRRRRSLDRPAAAAAVPGRGRGRLHRRRYRLGAPCASR